MTGPMLVDAAPPRAAQERFDARHAPPEETATPPTLVVDTDGELGIAFAARARSRGETGVVISNAEQSDNLLNGVPARLSSPSRLIVFLPRQETPQFAAILEQCATIVAQSRDCHLCVVDPWHTHSGGNGRSAMEEFVRAQFASARAGSNCIVRTGQVTDSTSTRVAWSTLIPWYLLVPASLTGPFLRMDELFAAIDKLTTEPNRGRHDRCVTLLGGRRPLRDALAEWAAPGTATGRFTVARFLSRCRFGLVVELLSFIIGRFHAPLRRWQATTLDPTSARELVSLCHAANRRHVALAGYNTGVNHFGWKYPRQTVVRTLGSGRVVRVGERTVTADAGVLLKHVIEEVAARGKELYVVPNYSYVSLGTTFMVPIHGSGSDVSTLGESIEQALVYDPHSDRVVRIRRGEERFERWMYDPASGIVVLRLRLRIRDKTRYFVKRSRLETPTAESIRHIFDERDASNIELRKTNAASTSVEVSRYYTARESDPSAMEVPRDAIGRLWDRLEENRVTSWLFHTFVRKCGFHVELFLDDAEFDTFWREHGRLPLSKLQIRLMKRDGLPHSPAGDGDRLSVDLFMRRRDSEIFLSFMKERLPHARFNPGKHSL